MNSRPNVNFTGLDGWRFPSRTQSMEKIGASMITKSGVHDCNQLEGNLMPKTSVRTKSFAKRFKLAPFCSYAAQNSIVNRKKTKIAPTRFHSPG